MTETDKLTYEQLKAVHDNFVENDAPNCCKNPELDRKGTGANEVDVWGCYICKNCGHKWYCYIEHEKPWHESII